MWACLPVLVHLILFSSPSRCSATRSCLHVYLRRVSDSVVSWSPSCRRHSWLIYHRLLTPAEPEQRLLSQQVSLSRLSPSRLEPFVNSQSRNNTPHTNPPRNNTHTHTHIYTEHFWENRIFCIHPSLELTLEYNAIRARSHTNKLSIFITFTSLPHSYVHKQEAIHSCSDREINKCQE